ncbi:UDP-4-amino-4,6-dideoxy-N-acetyl-beta-L-altrosamine transaminase [Algicella marina]|uniref:UDP-4-amino-4, 6-dideoxy-N-acetyl-beta-L-altrosamine transaminase n=1 Tax=Algicella marina TaxID=2683284 RepID=A0A6P1SZZ3_9RHOB|nr:UDP-4-amino-4,6-dideoxy-N-acetyl-beta-L-altrosamine transaminase [Algicella marina]QHQ34599.1 UDP-4-amino-4,6-dideoxy-N-acetyl-beta-L-altrosamine transaminase [Algicella marina]
MTVIPYGRQTVTEEDIAAVREVLVSDYLTQGPAVPRFEAAICAATGAEHAVATSSATGALHIACLALGVGPGDMVWTVPNTFVASANAALYCGADVDFVDINVDTWTMSVEALEAKLETTKRKPKVLIPVDLCGRPCDMAPLRALADKHGFAILSDSSHAIGASYRDSIVGDGRYADITVFSFHPVKIITTAEGGAATTNDPALARRLDLLRSHGITRDPEEMTEPSHGGWYYQQIMLGYNYRMTDMQAALGASQMTRLQDIIARRHVLARRYDEMLTSLPVRQPAPESNSRSALHLYPVLVPETQHSQVFAAMRAADILVNLHYIPVHLQPFYRARGFAEGDFPNAEAYYRRAISLPMFPALTFELQDRVVAELGRALGA